MEQSTKKKLQSLNDLFGDYKTPEESSNSEKRMIKIELLVPFEKHPFKLYYGKRFDDMVRSVKDFGILQPLIVRSYKLDSKKYEILAGHNRWNAAKNIGMLEVPIIVMDGLTDEEAMLIVTETNLMQRSFADLAHSERALVLAKHHEALKSQGKRNDLISEVKMLLNADEIRESSTCRPVGEKLNSDDEAGREYDLSGRTVSRYLRIDMLSENLKKIIDSEEIGIRAGVELSYLNEDNQIYLMDILNNNKYKVEFKTAARLRELQKLNKLTESVMESVLAGTYDKPKKTLSILNGMKVKSNVMKKYFNEKQTAKEVEEIIDKALELYYKTLVEKRDD